MTNAIVDRPRRRRRASLARAEHLLSLGKPKEAARCSRLILRRDREQVGALEVLAKALWQLGSFDDLLATLSTLTRLNPYEPGYHALRGAAHQCSGRTGEALKCFARAGSYCDTASASVEELRKWQGGLIAELLAEDVVFRTHYAQDPEGAVRARGFEFLPEYRTGETWLATPAAQLTGYARPS